MQIIHILKRFSLPIRLNDLYMYYESMQGLESHRFTKAWFDLQEIYITIFVEIMQILLAYIF